MPTGRPLSPQITVLQAKPAGAPAAANLAVRAPAPPPVFRPLVRQQPLQAKMGAPRTVPLARVVAPVVQLKKGAPKWSDGRKAARKAEMDAEHDMLWRERALTTEIVPSDEVFFQEYLAKRKIPRTAYRGDGRNVNAGSLAAYVRTGVLPKPGAPDITFAGVVDHTHSNSSPGGMVSTTSQRQGAIDWAVDDHRYGLVFEFLVSDYIDVNSVLSQRNFRNRYHGQYELLIPRAIYMSEVKGVSLYQTGGVLVASISYP